MWLPVSVRHDTSFLRYTERPLAEHLADSLNELEKEHGRIENISVVTVEPDKSAELLVRVRDDSGGNL